MDIKFERLDNYEIGDFENVRVITTAPHLKEIKYIKNCNSEPRIVNIDKEHYKVLRTEEIKERRHIKKRSDSKPSLNKTKRNIIDVINTNVKNCDNCKFITLTYDGVMKDTKILDSDINLFVKNFNYRYKCNKNIKVCVPQLRGTYHIHIIFIFDDIAPYIPYEEIEEMWGKGEIHIEKVYGNIDNLGVYLSSQICDVPMEEMDKYNIPYEIKDVKIIDTINGEKLDEPRYFVKNGIANIIPPGFRILRTSRNLEKKTVEVMKYHEARKEVGYRNPIYKSSLKITLNDKKKGFTNFIVREYYNLKRVISCSPNKKDLEALDYIKDLEEREEKELELYEKSGYKDEHDF